MLLSLSLFDSHRQFRGSARLQLDWPSKSWSLVRDEHLVWLRVCGSRRGTFEPRENGVFWLWNEASSSRKNTLIVWGAPTSPSDLRRVQGGGCMNDPRDPIFKSGRLEWTTGHIKSKSNLPPIRQAILQVLARALPAFPAAPKEPPNCVADKSGSDYKGVTNCGALPGWVVRQIPGAALLVPDKMYSSWKSRDATTGQEVTLKGTSVVTSPMIAWEQFAQQVEKRLELQEYLWIPYRPGVAKFPKPGDIYTLAKSSGKWADFSHVGFIIDSRGTGWITADAGQGGGFAVGYQRRVWDPKQGTLTLTRPDGSTLPPDLGTRYLKGWVDVAHLFKGWNGVVPAG
jgi:hypothetical protein